MTELRLRMIQDMNLRGLAKSTQQKYIEAIRVLSKHYNNRPPEDITEQEVHQFLIHLNENRGLAKSTIRVYLYAIKFLYEITLNRNSRVLKLLRIRTPRKKLPMVLSRQQVWSVLNRVRTPAPRMSLIMMYSCGLRVSEAIHLRASDIDSQRMVICVKGKGAKDRHVPLPKPTLQLLRDYWRAHRPQTWLFPANNATDPIPPHAVRGCLKAAARQAGISKPITCHTLRHSYATHLLESGADIRAIQAFLGHKSLNTTVQYLHMTQSTLRSVQILLDTLMDHS